MKIKLLKKKHVANNAKVLNNNLNSPYIVSQVLINVPRRVSHAKQHHLFSANSRINIRKNTFIPRVLSFANSHNEIDIFEPNKKIFKRHVISSL